MLCCCGARAFGAVCVRKGASRYESAQGLLDESMYHASPATPHTAVDPFVVLRRPLKVVHQHLAPRGVNGEDAPRHPDNSRCSFRTYPERQFPPFVQCVVDVQCVVCSTVHLREGVTNVQRTEAHSRQGPGRTASVCACAEQQGAPVASISKNAAWPTTSLTELHGSHSSHCAPNPGRRVSQHGTTPPHRIDTFVVHKND